MAETAFVALGSNLGDRLAYLQGVVELLAPPDFTVEAVSSVYETDPVGPAGQDDYLNAVLKVSTDLAPKELLLALKRIEQQAGRKAGERWGPREIDVDLLLYGDQSIDSGELKVPHPELTNRAFVMIPLLEIEPDLELPSGEPLANFCELESPGVRPFSGSLRLTR